MGLVALEVDRLVIVSRLLQRLIVGDVVLGFLKGKEVALRVAFKAERSMLLPYGPVFICGRGLLRDARIVIASEEGVVYIVIFGDSIRHSVGVVLLQLATPAAVHTLHGHHEA